MSHFVFCPSRRPLQGQPQPYMEKSGPSHLSFHPNLTFYIILPIYIWINLAATLCLPPSVSMTHIFECVCSPPSFLLFACLKLFCHPLLHHGALLRGLINQSGCLSVTPSPHNAVVPAAHMHTHMHTHNSADFKLALSVSMYKFLRVKKEVTLRVTKDCFPSRRILPRF